MCLLPKGSSPALGDGWSLGMPPYISRSQKPERSPGRHLSVLLSGSEKAVAVTSTKLALCVEHLFSLTLSYVKTNQLVSS